MKRSRFIALCLTLFLGTVSFAQTIKVSGTVTDSSNEPVIGVSVLVKGTTTGTSTDLDGKYELTVPSGATVEFSCIGYISQTFKAAPVIDVVLQEYTEFLDDVVVTGYMTEKKVYYKGVKFVAGRDEYLPIPLTQYNLSKGAYTQNPGYAAF